MNCNYNLSKHNVSTYVKFFLLFMFLIIGKTTAYSQTITYNQPLLFGTFTPGSSGGTITVSNTGARSTTGTVIALSGSTVQQAIFNIRISGNRTITAINISNTTLTRTGGGGSLSLTFTATNPSPPFALNNSNGRNRDVSVGGTLTIGTISANPAGQYSGTFTVTAIQQ